ncbi:Vacuolar ATP synthase subunit C [Teratosphaeriaceae sp. CCFEE 6253]|nr:Vacuolar ATP synthase subunit C [Teratosphaeriaceae sp. CCFEE 6253]
MPPQTFFLVSLPASVSPAGTPDEALTTLRSAISPDHGTTYPFAIPQLKVGTLESLVRHADELAKLESNCRAVVDKCADALRGLLDGDEAKLKEQKVVGERPVEGYLQGFQWNKVKYRADKPIAELQDTLSKEIAAVDNDIKGKFSQYNTTRTSLAQLQRGTTGNLSQKSLTTVVNPETLLQPEQSEYLAQHLLAVPNTNVKDFLQTYESLCPMIVPRSASLLAKDGEFALYAVVVFKKHSQDFLHKCREQRWTPREMSFKDGGREAEEKELRRLEKEERRIWGECLRLGRAGYGDAVSCWTHVLALRVFVETVLRYGLPLDYVCGIVKTDPKKGKKAKASLETRFADLGGNAMARDKKGRPTKDDGGSADMAGMGSEAQGYEPFVFYEFEIA